MSQSREMAVSRDRLPLPAILVMSAIFVVGLFLMAFDQGHAFSMVQGPVAFDNMFLHELFHDARHAAGFPCH